MYAIPQLILDGRYSTVARSSDSDTRVRLGPIQYRIMELLVKGPMFAEQLHSRIYAAKRDGGPENSCLHVHMLHLRNKLRHLHIAIPRTSKWYPYQLTDISVTPSSMMSRNGSGKGGKSLIAPAPITQCSTATECC